MGTQTVLIFDWDFPMEINHPASSPPRASRRHHGAVPRIQGPYLCTPRVVREHLRWKKHVETTQISHARCEMFTWVLHGFLDGGILTPLKIWKSVGMMTFAKPPGTFLPMKYVRRVRNVLFFPHKSKILSVLESDLGAKFGWLCLQLQPPLAIISLYIRFSWLFILLVIPPFPSIPYV